jgi:signal transduction histidine kinase/CheY-like chemotaxis protein
VRRPPGIGVRDGVAHTKHVRSPRQIEVALRRIVDHVRAGSGGPVPGADHAVAEVRELAALADALRADRRDLEVARDAANAASVAKSAFLANMSHELRTPLNAIIGYAELLAEDVDDPHGRADLQRILRSGRHLLGLISDILDLSKIEAGRVEMSPERVDLEPVCREVVGEVRATAEANGNRVQLEVGPELRFVTADPVRLKHVLHNLLSNAAKFTANGTISLVVRRTVQDGRPAAAFVVTDTGIGIAPSRTESIFEPFAFEEGAAARAVGGTGLGLAIARRFSRLMGGDLTVASELGKGSTFIMTLPLVEDAPELRADVLRPCLLLIDDDPEVHELAQRYLGALQAGIVSAYTAGDALALARSVSPDVIVLDLMMHDGDGLEVLAQLKADPATQGIPVVIQSVLQERARGPALGAVRHLQKPVSRDRFLGALRPWIGGPGGTVLVVDDDDLSTQLSVRALADHGWTIRTARDGREALDVLQRERPDVLLLDLLMPEFDGFQLLERIQADASLRDVGVVVYTAKALTRAERDRLGGRAGRVLEKGAVSSHDLLRHLQRIYFERRTTTASGPHPVGGAAETA